MKKVLLFILFFILFIPNANAGEKTVVVNEIMWMGSEVSSSDEWIELRNLTGTNIDISGWIIEGAASSEGDLVLSTGSSISANGYFLISNYSSVSDKSILDIEPDFVTSKVSLSNLGVEYKLKDNLGNLIDEVGAGPGYPLAGNKDKRWSQERILDPADGAKGSNWYTSSGFENLDIGSVACATPGVENSKEPESAKIADAKSAEREIIIGGIVTTQPDLLFGDRFYIQDSTAGIRVFLEDGKWPDLSVGDLLKIRGRVGKYHSEKELAIIDSSDLEILSTENVSHFQTNTGETEFWEGSLVRIFGKIVETSGNTFYVDDGTGQVKVYVKDELNINLPTKRVGDEAEIIGIVNNWDSSFRILPRNLGDIKIISQKKVKQVYDLPIAQVKELPKESLVITRGTVIAPERVLANTYFYIQDEQSGIQIYCWYKDFPDLNLGDYIKVFGEISEIYGEKRIKIEGAKDIIILKREASVKPRKIKTGDAKKHGGVLVVVRGRIAKSSGKTFYIDDGSGEIKIYVTDMAQINKPRTYKNDLVEIVGIVSLSKSGYRILSRYQSDFKLLWTKPKKEKKIKPSGFKKINFGEPQIMINAQKIAGNDLLKDIGYLLLFLSGSSLIVLGGLKYKKIL